MADQSFLVHLQSLQDFASELQTQLGGMATPIDHLDSIAGKQILLGNFAEAHNLAASHLAAITEMTDLLGQVQQAIGFAQDVTTTVANGYQQADQDAAAGMQVTDGLGGAVNNGQGWYSGGQGWNSSSGQGWQG